MPVTVDDIRALSPIGEFDGVKDPAIQSAIDQASLTIEPTSWCEEFVDPATANLAAHILALRLGGSNGVAGPVTSESAGGISRSFGFAGSTSGSSYYQKTIWGQEYERLLRMQPMTPIVGCSQGKSLYRC